MSIFRTSSQSKETAYALRQDISPFNPFPTKPYGNTSLNSTNYPEISTDDTSYNQHDYRPSPMFQCKTEPGCNQWGTSQNTSSVLNLNKKFRLHDENNYLLSLRQEACHRPAQMGQQKSVIMLAKKKDEYMEDNIKEEHNISIRSNEETVEEQSSKCDLKMFIQDRSFVEFSIKNGMNEVNEVDKMLLKTLNSIDIRPH